MGYAVKFLWESKMGKRGPKPLPTAEKKRLGNPGRRPLNDTEPTPDGRPLAPDYLDTYAKSVWTRVLCSMSEGVFTACDTNILAAYCTACSLHRAAVKQRKQRGLMQKGSIAPWYKVEKEQADLIAKLGTRLGLDPSARAAIKVPEKPKAGKFGQLTKIKGGKQ
jgi:P27 family predicted phage terminase small subunit